MTPPTAYGRLSDALEAATGHPGRTAGAGHAFRCPAHEDRTPSLTLTPIDGAVLIHCHAGCDIDNILDALHLTRADLYDSPKGATYRYDHGRVVHRTPDKRFWQTGNRDKHELFHLSRLLAAGVGAVFLVEGEKDVLAIETLGGIATTAPMGAANIGKADFTPLAGRHINAIVDTDPAGHQWATELATIAATINAKIRLLQAKTGKDAADHIAAGYTLDDFTPYQPPQTAIISNGTRPPQPGPNPDEQATTTLFDDDFWNCRAYLRHIRAAAHNRGRSAPAVLGVTLARVAALADHRLRLPAIVGTDCGLSFLTNLLGHTSSGKSSACGIGKTILPPPSGLDIADWLPMGTGEGMVEVFYGEITEPNPNGKGEHKIRQQVRHNAFFFLDEGKVLTEIGTRANSTLLPTVRSIFSGTTIGQTNASEERRRILHPGTYTIGLVLGIQPELAADILADAPAGTPQRMLWMPTRDPTRPPRGHKPDWPGELAWHHPPLPATDGWLIGENTTTDLDVAGPIRDQIEDDDHAWQDATDVNPLDAHANLLRLKIAALLAILDERLNITEEDWALAGVIKATSDHTRDTAVTLIKTEATKREHAMSTKLADRAAHADAVLRHRKITECAQKIAKKVWIAQPDPITVAVLRRELTASLRDHLEDGIEAARVEQWIVERTEPGQGSNKRLLACGPKRP